MSAFSNPTFFLVPVVAARSQLLLKSVSKLFENVEWSNSLLRHFKIQTLLKINCSMAAITAFDVTQHSQIFSLFFRNRIQRIALYQLHNSQALLNLRRAYYRQTGFLDGEGCVCCGREIITLGFEELHWLGSGRRVCCKAEIQSNISTFKFSTSALVANNVPPRQVQYQFVFLGLLILCRS